MQQDFQFSWPRYQFRKKGRGVHKTTRTRAIHNWDEVVSDAERTLDTDSVVSFKSMIEPQMLQDTEQRYMLRVDPMGYNAQSSGNTAKADTAASTGTPPPPPPVAVR